MENAKKVPIVGTIWKTAFNFIGKNPVILAPFAISGIIKLAGLAGIFFCIFQPLSLIFAPIIKTIWGEIYLHYPFNFVLMPRLFYYAQSAIYIFIDGLATGIAVWLVFQVNEGKKPDLINAIKKVLPKYILLLSFVAVIFLLIYAFSFGERFVILKSMRFRFMAFLAKENILDFLMAFLNFFVMLVIEAFFAFYIPFAVLKGKGFFKAMGGSLKLASRSFWLTYTLILVPTLILLPFSLVKAGLDVLMDKTFPEMTMVILAGGVIVTIFVDALVTSSLVLLFLSRKEIILEKGK